ncbi:MAG: hypothetical protein WDN29_08030 [Methylovirgula sp.]
MNKPPACASKIVMETTSPTPNTIKAGRREVVERASQMTRLSPLQDVNNSRGEFDQKVRQRPIRRRANIDALRAGRRQKTAPGNPEADRKQINNPKRNFFNGPCPMNHGMISRAIEKLKTGPTSSMQVLKHVVYLTQSAVACACETGKFLI